MTIATEGVGQGETQRSAPGGGAIAPGFLQ
jgi:hypothetical protein